MKRGRSYTYYRHGPLARTVIGENNVQGIDFAYTIQGWLKAVNADIINPSNDMGADGCNFSGNPNRYTARDAIGFSLHYFEGDYNPIKNNTHVISDNFGSVNRTGLFNGNICGMQTALRYTNQTTMPVLSNAYSYDQLNRLISANSALDGSSTLNYNEYFSYDANGNILKLKRNGNMAGSGLVMDSLHYYYFSGTNRLKYVNDSVGTSAYSDDFEGHNGVINYSYDAIGNLTADIRDSITCIKWNMQGKITEIHRTPGCSKPALEFRYDPLGNRIIKIVKPDTTDTESWIYTYYRRDFQGNVMSTYEISYNSDSSRWELIQSQADIYGSSRLGILQLNRLIVSDDLLAPEVFPADNDTFYLHQIVNNSLNISDNCVYLYNQSDVYMPDPSVGLFEWSDSSVIAYTKRGYYQVQNHFLGNTHYELTNHLGNVLCVITDRKIQVDSNSDDLVEYFNPDVIQVSDYYAFGSPKPGRNYSQKGYPFGFNGKKNDNETGTQDYGFRIYDPRICRFLSVDPLIKKFPWYSPFHFAGNMPIGCIDIDGLEPYEIIDKNGHLTEPVMVLLNMVFGNYHYQYGIMSRTTWHRVHLGIESPVNAETYSKTDINTNVDKTDMRKFSEWVGTVAHEQFHIAINNLYIFQFKADKEYNDRIEKFDYWNEPEENRARYNANIIKTICEKYGVEGILKNSTYTEEQKIIYMKIIGYEYKKEQLNLYINILSTSIENLKKQGLIKSADTLTGILNYLKDVTLKSYDNEINKLKEEVKK